MVCYVLEWAKMFGLIEHIDTFPSAEAFLFHYAEDKGYESVQIVFITGYSDYIAEGYDVSALHYLLKPVNKTKLFTYFIME